MPQTHNRNCKQSTQQREAYTMFVSILQNILDHERLEKIHNLLESAPFVDGRISGGSRQAKKNLELNPEADSYLEVLQIVEKAVRENHLFNFTAFPRYM